MKRILLFVIAVGFALSSLAQSTPSVKSNRDIKAPMPVMQIDGDIIGLQTSNTTVSSKATLADEVIMQTLYDLQTNSTQEERFYRYEDGTMAGVATMSHDNAYTTRGTGYNYYDGTTWGPQPSEGIEANRTGWPAYAPLGPNGEIVIAHSSATEPLYVNRRDNKGTGDWTQTELNGPAGAAGMLWCRMVTNGDYNQNVHVIALTSPTGNGGTVWNDLDGALIYNRSLDGGTTWDGWEQLDGMAFPEYIAYGGDSYAWAQPVGETLAFVVGDNWMDEFIMKSTDNGDTWTKTIIWDCPFDTWTGGDTTGNFRCSDGNSAAAIGPDGKVHVIFGYQESNGDESGAKYWFPWRDGLLYWNEDMPELPQELDSATLMQNGNYIGWILDKGVWGMDGTQLAYYYNSFTSIPSLVVDDFNQVFAFWSGVTTLLDVNNFMLRHIYARASHDGGTTWRDTIAWVTDDFLYTWSECVYVSVASSMTDNIFFIFQDDPEAGTYLKGSSGAQGQTAITNNNITFSEIPKADILLWPTAIDEKSEANFTVSQNYPNPMADRSRVTVKLTQPGNLSLGVYSVIGQKVMDYQYGHVNAGTHQFTIDGSQLTTGVYFYTVTLDRTSVTKKMVVK